MFSQSLHQFVTYWGPTGSDVYGNTTFSAPDVRKARWEDKAEMIRSKTGGEYVTKSRVFMDEDFSIDGYLLLGESGEADPRAVAAFEIQQRAKTPDLRALKNIYVAYL